jgi:hypothetical protein
MSSKYKVSLIVVRNAAKPKINRQQKSAWIYSQYAQMIFRGSHKKLG